MGSEERLQIPYNSIEEHIQCSICLSVIRGSVLTPCGHRYCTRCITEWVGRNHSCPCCNSNLQESQFYSDVQFDSLVEAVLIERDRAEQKYFDHIFNIASQIPSTSSSSGSSSASQFENIFKNHLKATLLTHQKYFAKLKGDFERKVYLLDSGVGMCLEDGSELDKESVKATLEKNLQESEKLAADAYDKYLTQHLPALDLLPVTVTVYIAGKDLRIPDIMIKPSDSLSVIKPFVEAAMQERCDELIQWLDDSGSRLVFSPFSKSDQYDVDRIIEMLPTLQDIHQLYWDSRPFFQCNLRPGSEIVLKDVFKCQSDLPKRCFASIYKESGSQPVDYFCCQYCNVKWICKSCIQCCHQGHTVVPFVMNHTPTWACCYCPKKKLCKIQEK